MKFSWPVVVEPTLVASHPAHPGGTLGNALRPVDSLGADDHGEQFLAQMEMVCSLANRVKIRPAQIFTIVLLAALLPEIYQLAIDNIQ